MCPGTLLIRNVEHALIHARAHARTRALQRRGVERDTLLHTHSHTHTHTHTHTRTHSDETFKEIGYAYKVLCDPDKRQLYDMGGTEAVDQQVFIYMYTHTRQTPAVCYGYHIWYVCKCITFSVTPLFLRRKHTAIRQNVSIYFTHTHTHTHNRRAWQI